MRNILNGIVGIAFGFGISQLFIAGFPLHAIIMIIGLIAFFGVLATD